MMMMMMMIVIVIIIIIMIVVMITIIVTIVSIVKYCYSDCYYYFQAWVQPNLGDPRERFTKLSPRVAASHMRLWKLMANQTLGVKQCLGFTYVYLNPKEPSFVRVYIRKSY